jgi:transposase
MTIEHTEKRTAKADIMQQAVKVEQARINLADAQAQVSEVKTALNKHLKETIRTGANQETVMALVKQWQDGTAQVESLTEELEALTGGGYVQQVMSFEVGK